MECWGNAPVPHFGTQQTPEHPLGTWHLAPGCGSGCGTGVINRLAIGMAIPVRITIALAVAVADTVAVVILIYEFTMSAITICFSLQAGLKSNRSTAMWLPLTGDGDESRCRGAGQRGQSSAKSQSVCHSESKLDSDMDSDLGHMPDLLLGANTADVRRQTEVIISFCGIVSFLFSPFELSHSPFRGTYATFAWHIKTNCTPPRAAHKSD